jgi:hypothetical protein
MRRVLKKPSQLGKTNWDAMIRVSDQTGNVIEFPLIVTLREPPIQVPQTPSACHPHAQRNAFRRRDVRPQRRLFAHEKRTAY